MRKTFKIGGGEMNKLITETEIVEYMVSNNYIVHMPPIKSYKVKLKIKSVKKGKFNGGKNG